MRGKALVTGAGKRLGRAMALSLAKAGLDVAVHYASSRDAAEEVADEIRNLGRNSVALEADFLDETQTEPLVNRAAVALGGPLTLLVNNASIFEHDTVQSASRTSWDRHLESNLRAPFVLTQAFSAQALAPMIDENGEPLARALVVNMIDQKVRKLTPGYMTYTIAKMGLWAFTQTASQALAPKVRVNAIGPGPTLQGAGQSADQFAGQRAGTVLGRGVSTADISAALLYLLNAPAVTGQLICVDGGQHLGWQTPDEHRVD